MEDVFFVHKEFSFKDLSDTEEQLVEVDDLNDLRAVQTIRVKN